MLIQSNKSHVFCWQDFINNSEQSVIINDDFINVVKSIPDSSIHQTIIDPPYGVDFSNNSFFDDSISYVRNNINKWMSEIHRIMISGSHIYVFVPTLWIDIFVVALRKYFILKNILPFSIYTTNRYFIDNFSFDSQFVLYGSKGTARRLNRVDWIPTSEAWLKDKRNPNPKPYTYQYPSFNPHYKANIKTNKQIKRLHPNQKNVKLLENLIRLSSDPNNIVFDGFAGSGSTLLAAKNTGRRFIGIEKDSDFFDIIKRRIA